MNSTNVINVNVTFRNLDATEPLKNYASEKLDHCLRKFVHKDTEVHLVLKVEKNSQIAEIALHYEGHDFTVKEESLDMYASIDALVDSLSNQLRKHKEKLKSHH